MDYGTISSIPTSLIYYLHKTFAVMPQQALRGRLAGVFPPKQNSVWSMEAKKRFYQMVAMKDLIGRVEKIDREVRFMPNSEYSSIRILVVESYNFLMEFLFVESYCSLHTD